MSFRGLIFLLIILIVIPVVLGKVSVGDFIDLLKSPTSVTGEQWKNSAQKVLGDVLVFYKNFLRDAYQKFRPKAEEKLKEQLKKTLDESLIDEPLIDKSMKLIDKK